MSPQNVQFKLCKENICVNFRWVMAGRWTLKSRLFLMVKLSWLAALSDVWLHVTERKMLGWKYDLNAAIYCLANVSADSWLHAFLLSHDRLTVDHISIFLALWTQSSPNIRLSHTRFLLIDQSADIISRRSISFSSYLITSHCRGHSASYCFDLEELRGWEGVQHHAATNDYLYTGTSKYLTLPEWTTVSSWCDTGLFFYDTLSIGCFVWLIALLCFLSYSHLCWTVVHRNLLQLSQQWVLCCFSVSFCHGEYCFVPSVCKWCTMMCYFPVRHWPGMGSLLSSHEVVCFCAWTISCSTLILLAIVVAGEAFMKSQLQILQVLVQPSNLRAPLVPLMSLRKSSLLELIFQSNFNFTQCETEIAPT